MADAPPGSVAQPSRPRQERDFETIAALARSGNPTEIVIHGARTHNLRGFDLCIPRDRFVVITGPSGSGKSSLAFDTLYAEGQRRYVESLSNYARQFLDQLNRPDVESIEGLSPAVAMVGGASKAVKLDNPEMQLPSPSATFHGRDIFSPAAALLASGQAQLLELGTELDTGSLMPLLLPLSEVKDDLVSGVIWWLDGFGNSQTNISPHELVSLGVSIGDEVTIRFGINERKVRWVSTFGEATEGDVVLFTDSAGMLSVAVVGGNAATTLQLEDDKPLQIFPN